MYDPKSKNDTNETLTPAPYADAAVNDEGLTSAGSDDELSGDDDSEDDELNDRRSKPDAIEEIEIEDIDYPSGRTEFAEDENFEE